MGSLRYLNAILTILAVLLAGNLWLGWHATPAGELLSPTDQAHAQGMVSAGAQRAEMIDLLKQANGQLGDIKGVLENGQVSVRVAEPESNENANR